MVKKNLFSFSKKHKKKKKKESPSSSKNIKKNSLNIKTKTKNKYKTFMTEFKKKHEEKIDAVKKFFLIITGYGVVINYSLYFIFGIKFNLFTFFAWGIAYYFISDEFVEWFRRIIAKR